MEGQLDDVPRQLDGLGRLLMSIDANVQEILDLLDGEEDEEEADT